MDEFGNSLSQENVVCSCVGSGGLNLFLKQKLIEKWCNQYKIYKMVGDTHQEQPQKIMENSVVCVFGAAKHRFKKTEFYEWTKLQEGPCDSPW